MPSKKAKMKKLTTAVHMQDAYPMSTLAFALGDTPTSFRPRMASVVKHTCHHAFFLNEPYNKTFSTFCYLTKLPAGKTFMAIALLMTSIKRTPADKEVVMIKFRPRQKLLAFLKISSLTIMFC